MAALLITVGLHGPADAPEVDIDRPASVADQPDTRLPAADADAPAAPAAADMQDEQAPAAVREDDAVAGTDQADSADDVVVPPDATARRIIRQATGRMNEVPGITPAQADAIRALYSGPVDELAAQGRFEEAGRLALDELAALGLDETTRRRAFGLLPTAILYPDTRELVERRGEFSKFYRAWDDTSITGVTTLVPAHYRGPDGKWHDIDGLLQRSGDDYINETNGVQSRLSSDFTRGFSAGVGDDRAHWTPRSLTVRGADGEAVLGEPAPGTPAVTQRNQLTHADAFPGVDNRYTVLRNRLEHDFILRDRPEGLPAGDGHLVVEGRLDLEPGLQLYVNGAPVTGRTVVSGPMDVIDASGEFRFRLAAPIAFEGDHIADRGFTPEQDLAYEVTPEGTGWSLNLLTPLAWLNDADRQYPVTLDPTVTAGVFNHGGAQLFAGTNADGTDWSGPGVDGRMEELSGAGSRLRAAIGYAEGRGGRDKRHNRGGYQFNISNFPSSIEVSNILLRQTIARIRPDSASPAPADDHFDTIRLGVSRAHVRVLSQKNDSAGPGGDVNPPLRRSWDDNYDAPGFVDEVEDPWAGLNEWDGAIKAKFYVFDERTFANPPTNLRSPADDITIETVMGPDAAEWFELEAAEAVLPGERRQYTVGEVDAFFEDRPYERGHNTTILLDDGSLNGDDYPQFHLECEITFEEVIPDQPPTDPVIDVTPSSPTVLDDMTGTIVTPATDPEGDTVFYNYEWKVNGTTVKTEGPTTSLTTSLTQAEGGYLKHQDVSCTAIATDGELDSSPTTDTETVVNIPPSTPVIEITPDPAFVTDDLTATITDESDDPDPNDTVVYEYEWFVNGTSVKTDGPTTSLTTTLTQAEGGYVKGDDVTVETFASDGEADSGTADDLTPVINSPPTAPAVEITPEDPKTLDDVTATVTTPSSDADGDAVQYTYEWYVNGSGPVFTDGPTSSTTSILDESHHVWTDDIHVVVTPNDGTEDGDTAQSNTVTVVNTPVVMSATSIDRLVGDENTDTFTATLEASDPDVDDGTQEYRYECDWSEGTPAVEETSAASVNFSKLYGFDGLFDVLGTVWDRPAGGGATLSTDSTLVATAEVLNVAPTLTISVDTATINEGDTATFTWNITDPGTDDNPPDFTPDVTWDFGDGSAPVTTSGLSGTVTHTYTQDSGCSGGAPGYSVTADTEDSDAAPDDDSLLMTVLNVAPTAVLETTDGPALREQAHRDGTDFTLSAASSSDVGAEDDASLEHEIVLVSYTPGPGRTAGDGPASTILPKGSATDVTVRLQLGVHVFELRTYDDCTVSTDTITLEVEDTTPPDIIPIQPADPSSLNVVGVPELEVITDATDICDEALDMQISNLVSTAGTTVADFNQFLDTLTEPDRHRAVTIPAADDILEITVCAVDDSGNLSEITYFVQIDATAPIVTIHSPVTTPKPSQPVEIFRNYTIARDCPEPNLGDESQFIPDDASECNPIPLIADAVDANPPSFPGPPHIGTGLNTDTYRVYVDGVEFYGPEVLALSGTIDGSPGQVVPVKPNVFLPPSKFADEGLNILGPHTLTIEVEDNAGNKGSASVDFEVVLVPIQAHIIVKNESTRGSEKGGVITFHVLNPMREYEGVVDRGNGPEFDGWKWEDVLQDPSTLVITSIYSGKSVVAESITKAGPLKYIVKARRKPLELDQEVGDDFVLQGAFPENCRWAGRDLTATHEDQDPRGPNPAGANKGGKK